MAQKKKRKKKQIHVFFLENNNIICYNPNFIQHKTLPFHFNNKMNPRPSTTNLQMFFRAELRPKKNEAYTINTFCSEQATLTAQRRKEKITEIERYLSLLLEKYAFLVKCFSLLGDGSSVPGLGICDSSLYMVVWCRATFQK